MYVRECVRARVQLHAGPECACACACVCCVCGACGWCVPVRVHSHTLFLCGSLDRANATAHLKNAEVRRETKCLCACESARVRTKECKVVKVLHLLQIAGFRPHQ